MKRRKSSILSFEELGFAKGEPNRIKRQGFPEAIYCPGKKLSHILSIFESLSSGPGPVLATRAEPEVAKAITARFPDSRYYSDARIVVWGPKKKRSRHSVFVLTAGTSDLPVAEEAAITAEALGFPIYRLYDVGVAGIHRLLKFRRRLKEAKVVVVCAGMEGTLPSVVGGLVSCPVIAVPTSVGYGAHLNGMAPLLAMLNSCAPNVSVVNIDDGFGAGVIASLIAK
jgi:pyridinium-3,5-biscarboxylic acid mononucleotide synthase